MTVTLPRTVKDQLVDLLRDDIIRGTFEPGERLRLEDIASPFINHLSEAHLSLTPTEVGICNMIRNGMRTKDIARIRGVSPATINRHREHIRRKLKIANSDINLMTYLQSSMWEKG